MLENLNRDLMLKIKKWGYLSIFVIVPILPWSWYQGVHNGTQDFWAWFPILFIFGIIPVLDYIIGKDPTNPDEETEVPTLSQEKTYRVFTLMVVPVWLGLLAFCAWAFAHTEFSLMGQVGWLLSTGVIGGVLAINVGHELIHKDPKLENWAGGFLYATVNYAGFKVEHIRGHHVHVSTPEDASSSRYNQSVYHFLPRAMVRNVINAWKLEKKYLERKGKPFISRHNELIWWYAISAALAVVFGLALGWIGVVFYVIQGLLAAATLEVINYIEHYGLHRRLQDNGRYERVTPAHSWNSNYFLTNLLLFQLQRHSDHHAYAKRRYQVLRHYEDSPQLPGGYASMFVLALIPPLWKKVMNPRVEAYYENELDQLLKEQPRQNKIAA